MWFPWTPRSGVLRPAYSRRITRRQCIGQRPEQQPRERSGEDVVVFDSRVTCRRVRSRIVIQRNEDSANVLLTGRVRQYAADSTALLKLPVTTSGSADLPAMLDTGFLQGDGDAHCDSRVAIHRLWQQAQRRNDCGFEQVVRSHDQTSLTTANSFAGIAAAVRSSKYMTT